MIRFSTNRTLITVLGAVLAAAVASTAVFLIVTNSSDSGTKEAIAQGRAYLASEEAFGVDNVLGVIKSAKTAKLSAEANSILQSIDSGETDVWSFFADAVILGDSRADDFQYYGYLPASRILADMGATCRGAEQYLQTATDLWPTRVYFTYGLNDVDGCWNSAADFTAAYKEIIQSFMDNLPYAEFYLCSILPVTQGAIDFDSNFVNIPEYNAALKQMSDEIGTVWIDCDRIMDGHEDLFADDGQHYYSSFYPIWGKVLAKAAVRNEYGLTSNS